MNSEQFSKFNEDLQAKFIEALDWLRQWGCSRSFGLGTTLPWDEKYLIESLSDSTIYMAYYTVAHLLQSDLNGHVEGSLGIKSSEIQLEDWDYIFLEAEYSEKNGVAKEKLDEMKKSFNYWYPLDLRCSGKDLIKNHLTMCLYNHFYIWKEKMLPRGIFANGWIMIDGEKMSKSKGNFILLSDLC